MSVWIDQAFVGDWGSASNWDNGIVPNAIGAVAEFTLFPVFGTIFIDLVGAIYTIGHLNLQSEVLSNYKLRDGILIADVVAGNCTINVGGSVSSLSSFDALLDVRLNDNTNFVIDAFCTLDSAAAITGAGQIIKQGSGTLTLSGSAGWTGGTDIQEGLLQALGSLGSGAVSISPNAVLELTGDLTVRSLLGFGNALLRGHNLTITGQTGNFGGSFQGTAGADGLYFFLAASVANFDIQTNIFTGWTSASDTFAIFGNALGNVINGPGVKSVIASGAGGDTVFCAGGNDIILLDDYSAPALTSGADIAYGGGGDDLIWGYGGNDILYGGAENDSLIGNDYGSVVAGLDNLFGGAGNDQLFVGFGGSAFMDGGAGNDTFYGGFLIDTLRGGTGSDYLYGNTGADIFQFYLADFAANDADIVYFVNAGDKLKFSAAMNGTLFFQNLTNLQYDANPAHVTTGVYITAFLAGGATAHVTVYGTTVAQLTPMVEYTL
jgi:autotransporter-associated beta strand protein